MTTKKACHKKPARVMLFISMQMSKKINPQRNG
ncbi:hypothetical protein RCH20_001899 [Psychrobacter sp. PL15]|nr:hypothetical protein [Psychrobacter sp. PL15]